MNAELEHIIRNAYERGRQLGLTQAASAEATPKAAGPVGSLSTGDWFGVLEELVRHGTERRGEAVVLMYDKEDGFWLSTVDCGCWHYPVKDLTGAKRKTLKAAVQDAVEWHNKQGEKWYMTWLRRLATPNT